jgi:hypothetical protein
MQNFNLSCQPMPGAPAGCKLVVYHNNTGPFYEGDTDMAAAVKPPFPGVANGTLQAPGQFNTAAFNATEGPLNRTELVYGSTIWPILFFHGTSTCNILLEAPFIHNVKPGQGYMKNGASAVRNRPTSLHACNAEAQR